jgi:hypothetical protein
MDMGIDVCLMALGIYSNQEEIPEFSEGGEK